MIICLELSNGSAFLLLLQSHRIMLYVTLKTYLRISVDQAEIERKKRHRLEQN